jgi:hypothetical protein
MDRGGGRTVAVVNKFGVVIVIDGRLRDGHYSMHAPRK